MSPPQFFFTGQYNAALEKIEDFIFAKSGALALVERFLDEHDQALEFVSQNLGAAAIHPATGDQSWVFSGGRYRIFFRAVVGDGVSQVFLTDIIDNRQANLHVYPGNSFPTFYED